MSQETVIPKSIYLSSWITSDNIFKNTCAKINTSCGCIHIYCDQRVTQSDLSGDVILKGHNYGPGVEHIV